MALGFLTRSGDRYGNTPETDLFLDRKNALVVYEAIIDDDR